MSVKVKICGITNLPDAQVAVEAGADMLGFIFAEGSPRQVTIKTAAEIAQPVPPHILKVGVFVDAEEDFVFQALRDCGLNLLQFHGHEAPEFCTQFGVMSMKAFRVRDEASLSALTDYPTDAWLLDTYAADKAGGTGSGVEASPRRKDHAKVKAFVKNAREATSPDQSS
jgi:phosphoribosylanthranilate isomerase